MRGGEREIMAGYLLLGASFNHHKYLRYLWFNVSLRECGDGGACME